MKTNDHNLNRNAPVAAKIANSERWTARNGVEVSVMTREDAGIDSDEPWVASCDTHGQMICCPTKESAMKAARRRDWCSECKK